MVMLPLSYTHSAALALALSLASMMMIVIIGKRKNDGRKGTTGHLCEANKKEAGNIVSVRLMDGEAKSYKYDLSYIGTLTWMEGDYESAEVHLKKRLGLMIKKNPWLSGRIISNAMQGTCHLTYTLAQQSRRPNNDDNDDNDDDSSKSFHLSKMVNVIPPSSSPLSRNVPFSEISGILRDSGLLVPNGPHEPVFKITLIPCSNSPKERFGLLVQLSHVVGDGATYYKLLNMLCSKEEEDDDDHDASKGSKDRSIVELIPERIHHSNQMQIETIGKEEASIVMSIGNIVGVLRGKVECILRGRTTQLHYGWVDASKMKEVKDDAAKEAGIPFVSTNDVITSWFLTQTPSRLGLMAINWRNRLAGYSDLHAGNYENFIFYKKDDAATPALIRQSLEQYKRVVTREERMPSSWEVATSSTSLVTNWATFGTNIEIEGCTEDTHLPIVSDKYFPTTFPLLIIFRANAGKVGLVYIHSDGVNHLDAAPFLERS